MIELLQGDVIAALVAFGSIALGTVSLILVWEGVQRWKRQKQISRQLEKLKDRSATEGLAASTPEELVKEVRTIRPRWLAELVTRLPRRQDLGHLLEQGDVDWTISTFLTLSLGLAAAAGLGFNLLTASAAWSVLAAFGGSLAPYAYVAWKRKQRFEAFEQDFPDAVDLLGRSMRAGHALRTGLGLIAEETPEPVRGEFRQVFQEQKFGLPIEESMRGLADRIDLMDVRIFVTLMIIQREVGGNLAESLANLSSLIRARFKFRRQLRVYTAQGRLTGYLLAALPIVLAAALYAIAPDHMSVLFVEPLGRTMLLVAVVLQILGFLAIRRVIDVEF